MDNTINNKLAFNFYVWANLIGFVLTFLFLLFLFIAIKTHETGMTNSLLRYILIFPVLAAISQLFDYLIQPAYIEFQISHNEIRFKSFNPNRNNKFRIFLMVAYKKYLIEQTINQQSYNNYILKIDRFGLRRNLILQKLENGVLYQSKPIDISFLGIKKYTNLILSIDRLQEKISLN
jgi:hypothetical protein